MDSKRPECHKLVFWQLATYLSLVLFTSCAVPTSIPAQTGILISTNTLTNTPLPTHTPTVIGLPTPTITPSPTSYTALPQQGPYLLYLKHYALTDKPDVLTIIGSHGNGRRVIELPEGAYVRNLQKAISPDGKWLAFHQGHAGWTVEPGIPSELNLNLLNLSDGTVHLVTSLLSRDYPESLKEDYELLRQQDPQTGPYLLFEESFEGGILALAWSPDERFLAFVGEMDGGSSDLYVYDVTAKTIRRLTNNLLNVSWIEWSPDGKWILYASDTPMHDYGITNLHSARPENGLITKPEILLSDSSLQGKGWLTPQRYLVSNQLDGVEPSRLRYLDLETKRIVRLGPSYYFRYAYDAEAELLAISGYESNPGEMPKGGLYLIGLDGRQQKLSENEFYELVFRGGKNLRFLGFDSAKVMGIGKDGSITQVSDKPFENANISPDRRWFVLYQEPKFAHSQVVGMALFSETDHFVRMITDQVALPIWRPDSAGLFFMDVNDLYYVSIPNGEPVSVDSCLPEDCGFSVEGFTWLP